MFIQKNPVNSPNCVIFILSMYVGFLFFYKESIKYLYTYQHGLMYVSFIFHVFFVYRLIALQSKQQQAWR